MEKVAKNLDLMVELHTGFEAAVERVTEALKGEGFGILTEIDVKATMKKKLDVDFRPYLILGACNPPLAYKALNIDPAIGLFLPCNVTVDQLEEGLVRISLVDPIMMSEFVDDPRIQPVADDARARLERVAEALSEE
jgi:uncharacterized protein (DUF302 family)